jgi:transposase-like protein
VEIANGATIAEICKEIGVTDQTYYRWRNEYGGMCVNQVKRLKELEKENLQVKKLVTD